MKERACGVRTKVAEGVRAVEEKAEQVLDRGGDALHRVDDFLQDTKTQLEKHDLGHVPAAGRRDWQESAPERRSILPPRAGSRSILEGHDPRGTMAEVVAAAVGKLNATRIGTSRSWFRPSWSPCETSSAASRTLGSRRQRSATLAPAPGPSDRCSSG